MCTDCCNALKDEVNALWGCVSGCCGIPEMIYTEQPIPFKVDMLNRQIQTQMRLREKARVDAAVNVVNPDAENIMDVATLRSFVQRGLACETEHAPLTALVTQISDAIDCREEFTTYSEDHNGRADEALVLLRAKTKQIPALQGLAALDAIEEEKTAENIGALLGELKAIRSHDVHVDGEIGVLERISQRDGRANPNFQDTVDMILQSISDKWPNHAALELAAARQDSSEANLTALIAALRTVPQAANVGEDIARLEALDFAELAAKGQAVAQLPDISETQVKQAVRTLRGQLQAKSRALAGQVGNVALSDGQDAAQQAIHDVRVAGRMKQVYFVLAGLFATGLICATYGDKIAAFLTDNSLVIEPDGTIFYEGFMYAMRGMDNLSKWSKVYGSEMVYGGFAGMTSITTFLALKKRRRERNDALDAFDKEYFRLGVAGVNHRAARIRSNQNLPEAVRTAYS